MKILELKNKKILVAGIGIEGTATLQFLKEIGAKDFAATDINPLKKLSEESQQIIKSTGAILFSGENYLNQADEYDVVIKSPGIKSDKIKAKNITSATQIFFENCPGKIVGITGSKGKSTTSTAIYKILEEGNIPVKLAGNIGSPMLSSLNNTSKDTVFVVELSSYQLEDITISPHISILTSIFPDHLDFHGTFDKYAKAKMNIFKYQTKDDFAIIPDSIDHPTNIKSAKTITFGSQDSDSKIASEYFWFNNKKIAPISDVKLIGQHNLRNISAAIAVTKLFNIPNDIIRRALTKVEPLPHRLNFIKEINNVEYWDDSIAVNPDATLAALDSFDKQIGTLILGGFDRELDFSELAEKIVYMKIPNLIFFPTTGEKIWNEIKKVNLKSYKPKTFFANNMTEAIDFAHKNSPQNSIVLLSPACPSFNMWTNFKERGEDFKNNVNKIG